MIGIAFIIVLVEISLAYSMTLVSGVQCNDLVFAYIVKWSAQYVWLSSSPSIITKLFIL